MQASFAVLVVSEFFLRLEAKLFHFYFSLLVDWLFTEIHTFFDSINCVTRTRWGDCWTRKKGAMIIFKLDLFNITKYFQYNIRFDSHHSKILFLYLWKSDTREAVWMTKSDNLYEKSDMLKPKLLIWYLRQQFMLVIVDVRQKELTSSKIDRSETFWP